MFEFYFFSFSFSFFFFFFSFFFSLFSTKLEIFFFKKKITGEGFKYHQKLAQQNAESQQSGLGDMPITSNIAVVSFFFFFFF